MLLGGVSLLQKVFVGIQDHNFIELSKAYLDLKKKIMMPQKVFFFSI